MRRMWGVFKRCPRHVSLSCSHLAGLSDVTRFELQTFARGQRRSTYHGSLHYSVPIPELAEYPERHTYAEMNLWRLHWMGLNI